jgi:hypothetical protein
MIEAVASTDVVINGRDKRLWKVLFEPPTNQSTFVLGEVPPSSTVVVPWQGLQQEETVAVLLTTASGEEDYQSFQLEDLSTERIRFHSKNLTPEEFEKEKEASCE